MFSAYRELFNVPGAPGFTLAGMLARLSLPMAGIGIIMLLSQRYGSYALAGAVSATFVVAYALLSPQLSRLADRYGQHRVLPAAGAVSVTGLLLLAAGSSWPLAEWLLFTAAALSGFMPGVSAMIRARWTARWRGQPQLQTAYSLESVLDEITFIAGPPLAVALSVALFPQAALLAAALLLIAGTLALAAQRGSEPPVVDFSADDGGAVAPMRSPGMRLLMLLMAAMGVIVGTIDVASVAFAERLGQPGAASVVLSAYALGSCAAGLLFGARAPRVSLRRQLLTGALGIVVTTLPLLMVESIAGLTATVLAAGLCFAPTMIVAMSLVEQLVPTHRLTEGMSWLLAGLNIGVAAGAAAAGQAVDYAGADAGFYVALGGAALLLLAALGSSRVLCLQQISTPDHA